MSELLEQLLEQAEARRCVGDSAGSCRLLRACFSAASDDVARGRTSTRALALRAVAAYQLGSLLLQEAATAKEGERLMWRLGFHLRLADDVLMYDRFLAATERGADDVGAGAGETEFSAPRFVDGALATTALATMNRIFGRDAPFWAHHEYPTTDFFSYNVPLDSPSALGALLRALRPHAAASVPAAAAATSGEVWAHARERDGAHQLHYDLDEAELRASGGVRSPVASSVFYLETIADDDGGAPTLVVDRVLRRGDARDASDGAGGWVCAPRENRLLTFDGRLLHCVVPTIARPAPEERRRITVMVGWWADGVRLGDAGRPGPNAPLPPDAPWLPRRAADVPSPPAGEAQRCAAVARVWQRIPPPPLKARRRDGAAFGDLACDDVAFTGRFFLRESPLEIDDAVLAGARAPPPERPPVEYVDAPVEYVDAPGRSPPVEPVEFVDVPAAAAVEYVDCGDIEKLNRKKRRRSR